MPHRPRAPVHHLSGSGTFFVTSGTYQKAHYFPDDDALKGLHGGLLKYAAKHKWTLEAWAVFSNHYHFVAHSPPEEEGGAETLRRFLTELHSRYAIWLNKRDGESGRKVWHNYREKKLTLQKSYLARLNYVHQNAVRHGLMACADQYPWCSAGWFEKNATPAQVKTIYGLKIDEVNVFDPYEPVWHSTGERNA